MRYTRPHNEIGTIAALNRGRPTYHRGLTAPSNPSHLLHSGHETVKQIRPYLIDQVALTLIYMPVKRCPRCGTEMATSPWPPRPGRPSVWCSQQCRRAAYQERRAENHGAVAVRIEVVEKPVERIVRRVQIETRHVEPRPAEAAQIVLRSPRACRTVLESLRAEVDAFRWDSGAHAPTLRAAERLLAALKRARLIDG